MIRRAVVGPRDVVAVLCAAASLSTLGLRAVVAPHAAAPWAMLGLGLLALALALGCPMILRMIVDEG